MIRMEKLIEDGALFRQSLEGRFSLDIMRSVLQTGIAAGVNLEAYMTWVMMMPEDVIKGAPSEFTPLGLCALSGNPALNLGFTGF